MKNRRKQRETRAHVALWVLFVGASLALLLGVCAIVGLDSKLDEWFADLPDVEREENFSRGQKSTVYAADGTTVLAEFQMENRTPLESLDDISEYVVKGTVATEDARFYSHDGVDVTGVIRAALNNLLGGGTQGASTITQQLVRNTLLADEATDISIKRKVREIKLALEMEKVYPKDKILLMYLNTINYGDGCMGIQSAAAHYFGKTATELTIAEAAALVGIPQSPTAFNPVYYPDACVSRRNDVLGRLRSTGAISSEEYEAAKAEELTLHVTTNASINGIYLYPYFTSYVRDQLLELFTETQVYEGGLTVYTTLDVTAQKAAEAAVAAQYGRMREELEAALVAIDPTSGQVKAMIGGKDFAKEQFNIATQKGRPTGSTFKAFTLVTAIMQGINPATLVDCTSPMTVKDAQGKEARIENYGNTNYGICSIQKATAVSSNTGYVRLQQQVTASAVVNTAHVMGVTQEELPEVHTLTLGVADVTPLDMASAYGTLAAAGMHYKTYSITKVLDAKGKVVFEQQPEGERALSESVCGAATDVLKTVFTSGTASTARLAGGRPVAGKTGTTENDKDHWLVGYTPNLVCATWIGDRYNKISDSRVKCNTMFKEFMDAALANVEAVNFPKYTAPSYTNPWNESQNRELSKLDPAKAPSTVGMAVDAAKEKLKLYNVVVVEETSATVAKGKVISQTVESGKVVLHVSKGS